MKCLVCLRKHLALFNSFARQVINGHGEGAVPDHRIDLEGEITNAEYHASLIDEEYCRKLRCIRRDLIRRKFKVEKKDMENIEAFYYYLDRFEGLKVNEKYVYIIDNIEMAPKVTDLTKKQDNTCGCQSNKES